MNPNKILRKKSEKERPQIVLFVNINVLNVKNHMGNY